MGGVDAGCWQNRVISFWETLVLEKKQKSHLLNTLQQQSKVLKQCTYKKNTSLHENSLSAIA